MSKAPSMPMFWDAYLADTTHLTTEEHGAYLLLLAAMWRRNGFVPDDDKDNARILGLTVSKWRKTKRRLSDFLIFEDGHISQKNLQKIWEKTQEKINKNRENGSLGGRPKSNKNNSIPKANGSIYDNRNETIPEPEPYIDTNVSIIYSGGFDDFWQAYPRKIGKDAASKAYTKAVRKTDHETIMAGLRAQLPKMHETEKQFIPHASTWLNQGRWQDEPEQLDNGNKSGQGGKRSGMVDALASVAERYRTGEG